MTSEDKGAVTSPPPVMVMTTPPSSTNPLQLQPGIYSYGGASKGFYKEGITHSSIAMEGDCTAIALWMGRGLANGKPVASDEELQIALFRRGYDYSRSGNPTRNCLEKAVAVLDGAKYCLAYASGLAATLNVAHLLKAGDQIICNSDVYGGTNRYFRSIAAEMGLKVVFVDCSALKCLEAAITSETKLVWIETPTNPTLTVIDIQGCADIVHKHQNIILAVDNTFMSAYFQRPLALGADICMYSATKYMNGHSDVVMGLVSVNCDKLYEKLKFLQNALGAIPSPFDCYLCNRGLKTLPLRMRQHFHNALATAMFLERDPRVDKVLFPGLPSHPQYELTKRQSTGVPGMITFYIKGNVEHATLFLKSLKVFALAESLGGYESLAEHPAIMTHASVPEEDRALLNISDTLIRLSIGLEDTEDIIEDINQALQVVHPGLTNPTKVKDLLQHLKCHC